MAEAPEQVHEEDWKGSLLGSAYNQPGLYGPWRFLVERSKKVQRTILWNYKDPLSLVDWPRTSLPRDAESERGAPILHLSLCWERARPRHHLRSNHMCGWVFARADFRSLHDNRKLPIFADKEIIHDKNSVLVQSCQCTPAHFIHYHQHADERWIWCESCAALL